MRPETICPIFTNKIIKEENRTTKTVKIAPLSCVHEQCAWWIDAKQKCAIAVMGGKKS